MDGNGQKATQDVMTVEEFLAKVLTVAQAEVPREDVQRNSVKPPTAIEQPEAGSVDALQDRWLYRMVVVMLGVVLITATLGGVLIALLGNGASVPDVVVALGSGAVGALAGLLAPTPGAHNHK